MVLYTTANLQKCRDEKLEDLGIVCKIGKVVRLQLILFKES